MGLVNRKPERDTLFSVDTRFWTSYRRLKSALLSLFSRERRNGSVGPQLQPLTCVIRCLLSRESNPVMAIGHDSGW